MSIISGLENELTSLHNDTAHFLGEIDQIKAAADAFRPMALALGVLPGGIGKAVVGAIAAIDAIDAIAHQLDDARAQIALAVAGSVPAVPASAS